MKRIWIPFLSMCLLLTSFAWAEEAPVNDHILTVEKAQEIMIQNSLQLKADQMNIDDLKQDLEDTLALAEKRKNVPGVNVQNYVNYREEERVDPIEAQRDYDMALRSYQQEEETEKLEILKVFYELQEKNIEKQNEEISYDILLDEYDELVKKHELGQVSSFDVAQKEIDVKSAKMNLDDLYREYDIKIQQLFDTLMMENPEDYTLSFEGLDEVAYPLPSLEAISEKIESTPSVYKATLEEEIAKIRLDYTDDYYKEGTDEYRKAAHDRQIASMNLRDARLQQQYQIQSDYNGLVDSQEQRSLSVQNLELLKEKLELSKAQYDLGLITEMDVRKAQKSLDAAELSYLKLLHQYETQKYGVIIDYELY